MLFQMMYSFQIETQYNLSFGIVEKIFPQSNFAFLNSKCTMMRKVISNLTKSTLKGPGGTQRRLSKGNLDVMQSAHSPPPRVTCKVAKILLSVDSTEKTQWVKEPLS